MLSYAAVFDPFCYIGVVCDTIGTAKVIPVRSGHVRFLIF
jgi:hypothetical protein